ncbi:acyltransferase GLAUCE-like [Rhododendron vialii]|uniref:acyltransferase GLAUCE-like n=1 Tax=Rhododendron vialii TaxID=182163 RepID=UPI00265DCF91|nr:acyltransferase GLAUCE-like [Rhododendron vialii]
MENLKLVKKTVVHPEKPTRRRRIFLSNIDLGLIAYQESVSFFDPPQINFVEACEKLNRALERLFVHYDFFAGRLVPSLGDGQRLEIECNGAGVVVVAAETETKLSQLGDLMAPKPDFKQFTGFLNEANEEEMEIKDMPLLFIQLTQLGCGGVAFASRYNHCVLDGVAVREFQANMAALTLGKDMMLIPNPDRTMFRARNPPLINHPHHEYSKPIQCKSNATFVQPSIYDRTHLIHLPPHRIANIKKATMRDGKKLNCTTFQAVAAKIWKARSVASGMEDERISTMLFPVDCRKRVVPQAPIGFSGNALIPGFARVSVKELKEEEDYVLVEKVKEGLERLDDEYVRSSIDWLEVNKGVPCREDSFSLVAWWRLGLEEDEFVWGKSKCNTPVSLKPGLVYLLPGLTDEGGLNICLELPNDQIREFHRLMMEG